MKNLISFLLIVLTILISTSSLLSKNVQIEKIQYIHLDSYQKKALAKNLGVWVSPYGKEYISFFDDGTIDRYLYFNNKSQWIGHGYHIDNKNEIISVTHSSTGNLIASIYFTNDGKLIWEYSDGSNKRITFRKVGVFEPNVGSNKYDSFSFSNTWVSSDKRIVLSFFSNNKSAIYYPYGRALYETTHSISPSDKKMTLTFRNGATDTYSYEIVHENHMTILIDSETFYMYKEKDTEILNRGANAALKLLGLFLGSSSSSNSSLSTDQYSRSSWLKNEHERQSIDRARRN